MQYIIINGSGNIIAQYSSWNKKELEKEIVKFMNENKHENPKAFKCKLTHQVCGDKLFKLID